MAKRSLVASWARLFNRSSKVLAKAAVRQQKALLQPVKAAKRATPATAKAVTPTRAARPAAGAKKKRPPPLTRAGRIAQPALDAIAAQHRFPKASGDWLPGLAIGPAGTRRFTLYRPAVLRGPPVGMALGLPLPPAPLVVMLHGCAQNGRGIAISSRMHRLADRHGFFVLYPEQDTLAHPQGCWRWYELRSGHAQSEAQTLQLMIDQVCLRHAIDRGRVALAGLSAGAGMAALMATREPLRTACVVMHSGVAPGSGRSTATGLQAMRGSGSVALPPEVTLPPLMVLQGSADRVVSPANGRAAAEAWAAAAGARAAAPRSLQRGTRHAMTVTDYRRARRTMVRLVEIEGLGHAWSGGDAAQSHTDPAGPDASRLAWAFMQACFRRKP